MTKLVCDIAVFMPAYNAELYIRDALNSVLGQEEKNFLIIVSDDASKDNTVNIIRDIAKQDNRIILLENKNNIGINANFNKILDYIETNVECKYIAIFSGDDLMHPKRLLLEKQALDQHLDADVCFSPAEVLNHAGSYQLSCKVVGIPKRLRKIYSYDFPIKNGFAFMPNSALLRSSIVQKTRFATDFSADFVFFIEILMQSKKKIIYIDEPLMTYRRHAGGLTSNIKPLALLLGTINYYLNLIKNFPRYTPWLTFSLMRQLIFGGYRYLTRQR